jgi:glycosyltransferase involved in cell wall biosynthesis
MKHISIVTPCYNEAENVEELARRIREVMAALPEYSYEHLFADNASTDNTVEAVKKIASGDSRIKLIVNNRNFGHIRSPYHAMLQASGDAVIAMASDLQDPPELIKEFLQKWEEGFAIVVGQKAKSEESPLFFLIRKIYYRLVDRLADTQLLENVTGFGLYDRRVMEEFRKLDDPYPYVRGLISELGFSVARVVYEQPTRKRGISKNNFYTLYDLAMLGITSHSKVPLRLATMLGFLMSLLSFVAGMGYLFYKLIFWNSFSVGIAPLVIGLFFLGSVQMFFLGIIGEYIGFIHTQVMHRPLVVEKERINFSAHHSPVQSTPLAPGNLDQVGAPPRDAFASPEYSEAEYSPTSPIAS